MAKIQVILSLVVLAFVLNESFCKRHINTAAKVKSGNEIGTAADAAAVKTQVAGDSETKRHVPTPDYKETSLQESAIAKDGAEYSRTLGKYVAWTKATDQHNKNNFSKVRPANPFRRRLSGN